MVLCKAHVDPYYGSISSFLKSKQLIQTVQHDIHMKTYLEIKLYIFFTIYLK